MLNTKNNFKALSLSTESEVLNSHKLHTCNNDGRLLSICEEGAQSFLSDVYGNGYTSEKKASKFEQSGRSMIEMLGVLAIIGVLSVGGIAGYSKAMMKFKTNKTIDQIAMTVTNIRTLYAQQKNYSSLSTSLAYSMGVVDDAMATTKEVKTPKKDDDGKVIEGQFDTSNQAALKNAFNGPVYLAPADSGATGDTAENGAFIITFGGLPREACVTIATNDWGSNYSSGLLGIRAAKEETNTDFNCYVASTDSTKKTAMDTADAVKGVSCAAYNKPLSVSEAASGCDCDATNACEITLKYY